MTFWLRLRCRIFGHDDELAIDRARLTLRCVTCGNESPGWNLALPPISMRARVVRFRRRLAS